ncbi:alpha/beta fold hydrolase [Streptomyces sp. NPDC053513]|uniref:alpha/beta fold hydrolase n=1 Tax=unclassified Streptomyces TaxID=2593676 RepID=UPI0037D2B1D8
MPTFTTQDGTELAYRVRGEGEPLVCLAGGPMRDAGCLGDLGGLAAHRALVLLDARGTGASAEPADPGTYRCDRQVDDVEALRVHLGLDRIDLLGHSDGGNLAVLYAAAHPERIRSLVLVTSAGRALDVETTDEEWDEAVEVFADRARYPEARAALDSIGPGTPPRRVREITAPVLIVAGRYDAGPTTAEAAAFFPHAELVVQPGAGHFPWVDDADAFARTVAAFLDPAVRTVTVDGVRLAHRVTGAEDAPPVVLVHGRGENSTTWTEIAEDLAVDHRVYAVDLRGHGLSDRPGRYGFEDFRDELGGFLKALGLTGATVVAHSMGAGAAHLLAQSEPGLIGRLVLEEAPAFVPLDPPRPVAERPEGPLAFDWAVVPTTDAQLNAPDPAWREGLAAITAPTLVIAGGPTSHIPQDQLAGLADRIPDARLVTIGAGHLVHNTRPAEFLAAIREFGVRAGA